MHVFGLTGGIASGKSTIAAQLRSRGVPVTDADELAREVVAPGSEGLQEIVHEFGGGVLQADGSLDRKALARIVFADDDKRRRLNAITHPRISREGAIRAAAYAAKGEPLSCWEAALIIENKLADVFRPLIVAVTSREEQLDRLVRRDTCSKEEALARIASQMPADEKRKFADVIIDTTGERENTRRLTDEALLGICKKLGIDPARYSL